MKNLIDKPHALKVSVDALATVAPFAAHQDIRYFLEGIAVMPLASGGVLAVATNGHAILCARDPEGHAKRTVILPITNKRNKDALKKDRNFSGNVYMTDDGTIYSAHGKMPAFIVPEGEIDGRFPDLRKVFGKPEDYKRGIVGAFALRYLKMVGDACKNQPVLFWTRRERPMESVGLFTIGDNIFGGVMPLRLDKEPSIERVIPPDFFAANTPSEA